MSKKLEKVCTTSNYIEQFVILVSTITGCASISAFASLIVISIEITSSNTGLEICAITAGIKKYKSILKKKIKKHDKIVLNRIEIIISKALIASVINHGELVLIQIAWKEYNDVKENITNSNNN